MQRQTTTCCLVLFSLVLLANCMTRVVSGGSVSNEAAEAIRNHMAAQLDSSALRMISDEDQAIMQLIKYQVDEDFANFKSINEVHAFLDKVKLLVQKHPKNIAFAQGDLKDLHRFLSAEIITRLIRVDIEPFIMPISDDRVPLAQRAIDEDELTRKLFSGPLRSLIEAKKQQVSRAEDGNHRDGNFFSNVWCKISGHCSN